MGSASPHPPPPFPALVGLEVVGIPLVPEAQGPPAGLARLEPLVLLPYRCLQSACLFRGFIVFLCLPFLLLSVRRRGYIHSSVPHARPKAEVSSWALEGNIVNHRIFTRTNQMSLTFLPDLGSCPPYGCKSFYNYHIS
jgi:hypothetical protein